MDFLLIWDIDGTLIQSGGVGKRAMDRAFLDLHGIREAFKNINMAGMLDPVILDMAYEAYGISGRNPTLFYDKYTGYLEEELKRLDASIAAPGIVKLLQALEAKGGFYNALGTGNIEKGARLKLSPDKLNRFFPVGGFGDEGKERWQVIKSAIVKSRECYGIDFDPDNMYIIGDTPKDIECGKKLNARTIGVATGSHSTGRLLECQADYVFGDLTDLDAFLGIFIK